MSPITARNALVALVAALSSAPALAQTLTVTSASVPYTPLSGTTTTVTLSNADDGFAVVPLGFSFPFSGTTYTDVVVNANGLLYFTTTPASHTCANASSCRNGGKIPNPTRLFHNFIAPWWADLFQQPGGVVRYSNPGSGEIVIEYFEHGYFSSPTQGKFSFQVRLNAGGLIQVHYGTHSTGTGSTTVTAGFEDATGTGGAALLPCASASSACSPTQWPTNTLFTIGQPVKADLVVSDVTLANMVAGANLTFDVNASFKNFGQTAANGFIWKAFLSKDTVLDASDTVLHTATATLNAAGGGGGATATASVNITPKPAPGTYYVLVQVNPNNAIDEATTGNNVRATSTPFTSGLDLQAVAVSGPATATVGANLAVNVRFANLGSDPVPSVKYRVLLSADKILDGNDKQIYEATTPVTGAQTVDTTVTFPLPSGVNNGDFFYVLDVDSDKTVAESNETNNVVFSTANVKVDLPDLAVTMVDFLDKNGISTRTGYLGQPAKMKVTVTNVGKVVAPAFKVGILLSEDATAHFGNDTIFFDGDSAGLLPNESRTLTFDVQLPTLDRFNKVLTTRDYYLFAAADSFFTVPEVSETNNALSVKPAVRLIAPSADYVFGGFTAPAKVAPGDVLAVHRIIRNMGDQPGPQVKYRYYASANEIISASDFPLRIQLGQEVADFGTVTLAAGESHEATENLLLPADIPPGAYYLGALIDEEREVPERDEGNNSVVSAVVQVGTSGVRVATSVLPDALLDQPYQFQLSAAGLNGDGQWSVDTELPDGLLLSEEGVLSGTPKSLGNTTLTFRVKAGTQEASARILLRVLPVTAELRVSSVTLPAAVKGPGVRYEASLAAAGGVMPYSWRLRSGSLPAGLKLAENGVVSGVLDAQVGFGTSELGLEVRDASGSVAIRQVTLRVVEPTALLISEASLPNGMVGTAYQSDLSSHVANSNAPASEVNWTIAGGALPDGVNISSVSGRGILAGAPTRSGVYTFTVEVRDTKGRSDSADFVITVFGVRAKVKGQNMPSSLWPTATPEFSFAFDTKKEAKFTLFSGALPKGLKLEENGTVTGTVAEDAPMRRYDFIVAARDTDGTEGYGPFAVEIGAAPPAKKGCSAVPGELLGAAALGAFSLLARRRRR